MGFNYSNSKFPSPIPQIIVKYQVKLFFSFSSKKLVILTSM